MSWHSSTESIFTASTQTQLWNQAGCGAIGISNQLVNNFLDSSIVLWLRTKIWYSKMRVESWVIFDQFIIIVIWNNIQVYSLRFWILLHNIWQVAWQVLSFPSFKGCITVKFQNFRNFLECSTCLSVCLHPFKSNQIKVIDNDYQ